MFPAAFYLLSTDLMKPTQQTHAEHAATDGFLGWFEPLGELSLLKKKDKTTLLVYIFLSLLVNFATRTSLEL